MIRSPDSKERVKFALRLSTSRSLVATLVIIASALMASCSTTGGKRLVSSHMSYNDSVQLTMTREVLTNIVRSRYGDPMQFIAVQSINAQFSVSANVNAGAAGTTGAATSGDVGASIGYSDSPTITFVPQVGSEYFESLYSPLTLSELVGFVVMDRYFPGTADSISFNLRVMFAAINGARDIIGGEPNALYDQRISAVTHLLEAGGSLWQVPEWDMHTSAIAKSKVLGEDMVEASKAGLYWLDVDGDDSARLAKQRMALAFDLPVVEEPSTAASLRILGLEPGRPRYFVRSPKDAKPGKTYPDSIWVSPRSMVEVMMVAAGHVDVPSEHRQLVPDRIPSASSESLKNVFHIRSSRECPPFPYRVMHRGFCFYVDDTDVRSRLVLEALVSTYTSRMGGVSRRNFEPQLVIPVG